jgi:flagellar biosynthesis protein FlhA
LAGLTAKWVPQDMQRQAEITGATVVDRSSVITTHLAEIV